MVFSNASFIPSIPFATGLEMPGTAALTQVKVVPVVVEVGVYKNVLLLQIWVVDVEDDKLGEGLTETTTCCAVLLQPFAVVTML